MAKTTNVGYTDTPISGVTSLAFARGLLNFKADFRVKQSAPNEVVLTNLTSPSDRSEKVRIAFSEVNNIYNGTNIDPSVYAPTKGGVSVLLQLTEIWSTTDNTDAAYRVDRPVSAQLVLKYPNAEEVTAEMVQTMLGRLVSTAYETGVTDVNRLKALLRGSLLPADLK